MPARPNSPAARLVVRLALIALAGWLFWRG